jgi:hypothetical protein
MRKISISAPVTCSTGAYKAVSLSGVPAGTLVIQSRLAHDIRLASSTATSTAYFTVKSGTVLSLKLGGTPINSAASLFIKGVTSANTVEFLVIE